jgi:hypothetical protein
MGDEIRIYYESNTADLDFTEEDRIEAEDLKTTWGYKHIYRCKKCARIYGTDEPDKTGICAGCGGKK